MLKEYKKMFKMLSNIMDRNTSYTVTVSDGNNIIECKLLDIVDVSIFNKALLNKNTVINFHYYITSTTNENVAIQIVGMNTEHMLDYLYWHNEHIPFIYKVKWLTHNIG